MRDITLALFALACALVILQDQAHSSALPQTPQDALSVELTDVECLALNIYHEARGESVKGHALVAQGAPQGALNKEEQHAC